jgi:hypothetical protein
MSREQRYEQHARCARMTDIAGDFAKPFVFVSIPGTGSGAVHHLLGRRRERDSSSIADPAILDNHATFRVLLERYGPTELARRFTFSFVRNPWARCNWWFRAHAALAPYSSYNFHDWIRAGMPHHWVWQNASFYASQQTPLRQKPFLIDHDGGDVMVDFVGRVESFHDDIAYLARLLSIHSFASARRRILLTPDGDHRRYYTEDTADLVATALADDIATFGYRF